MIERRLALTGQGASSAARILDDWYVACFSTELSKKPLARVVCGVPLVLFRTAGGEAAALLDRCPHRNVPLSIGRVQGEFVSASINASAALQNCGCLTVRRWPQTI